MSEAYQKPNQQNPEGYSPKERPEILKMMEQKSATVPSETDQNVVSGGEPPRLSDIRPLLDGMKGHNYALPDCIKFILERVGGYDDLNFWNIAALTGDTIAQVYNHNPAVGCEYCVSGYLSGPEHIAHVFDVLGYDCEYVTAEQFNAQTTHYLQKIAVYINSGVPVLVKTNLNDIPAWKSDVGTHCLIVGYNPEKNVLELLVSGTKPIEYEITDDNKLDLIFIGEKRREVSREEVYLSIIRKMPDWLTLQERNGLYFGSAAYRAWADDIDQGRFAEEGLPLWENYGVYVCNLATNGDFAMFHLRELAEMNPRYSGLSRLNSEILKLIPTEKPDGSGRNLLWIQLDELCGGMDLNAVRETMHNKEKRSKVAAALRDSANRLDQVVELLTEQTPEGYSPKERPEILSLAEDARQIEKLVQTITYKSVGFEIVRRLDVIWVGCVDYAANNTDESNIGETLKRFQGLVETAPIKEKVNPDWSAALSINYTCSDKPCGLMFANESYTDQQDERYDTFIQPGGLWLRIRGDDKNAKALLGKDKAPLYEFFEPLRNAAKENGYLQNPDVPVEVEYHCHAEYNTPPHTCYAYIPVIKTPGGYSPKERPEIISLAEQVQSGIRQLPPEFILKPKDRIASFSGEKWPYSNVEPAVYAALGLFYGRTERRGDSGALVNDDVEYAVHNVLTGHAFGLFYCLPDDSLSMAAYGFSSSHPDIRDCSQEEITALIKTQICSGNAVHIDEGNGQFDYLIWGYKDNGNRLLGYQFEHGNDGLNCSFDFDNPIEFDSLIKSFSDPALYQKNGEKIGGITFICPEGNCLDRDMIYRRALAEGVRMLTQTEPAPAMDFEKVHYGYGQAIYDEWIRQIEQADAEDRAQFFDVFPIFPHFIALYENRLQLLRFLKNWNKTLNREDLKPIIALCEKLHQITGDAATVSAPVNWNRLKDAPNHEKRVFLIERLKECRALEIEIADALKAFLEKTKE